MSKIKQAIDVLSKHNLMRPADDSMMYTLHHDLVRTMSSTTLSRSDVAKMMTGRDYEDILTGALYYTLNNLDVVDFIVLNADEYALIKEAAALATKYKKKVDTYLKITST